MLSYQSLILKGTIHSIGNSPYSGDIAELQMDGFNGLLVVPIDDASMYEVGDSMEVQVQIDRISNLSRFQIVDNG